MADVRDDARAAAYMIVGMVPTFREGPLAADAVRSLLPCCQAIFVCEGAIGEYNDHGSETDWRSFARNQKVFYSQGGPWVTEADKRNYMLEKTRRFPPPVWGVYVDADEVLLHAELVPSLIWAAEQRAEPGHDVTAIPLLITEASGGVARIHRLIRLDRLERHILSMSQLKFFDQTTVPIFPNISIWQPGEKVTPLNRPPLPGEPHLHHRSYLRPPVREEYRLHKTEVADYIEQNRDAIAALGFNPEDSGTPVHIERPEMIIATDTGETDPDPFGILKGV